MTDKVFHLKSWSPELPRVAERMTGEIRKVAPELEVLFTGAAALGLPGKNDIDLDIMCDAKDVPRFVKKLEPVLGQPGKVSADVAEWSFMRDGFEMDVMLSDPRISHLVVQRPRFELLRANPELLEEYRRLKVESDGLPMDEYIKRKEAFFEKIFPAKPF